MLNFNQLRTFHYVAKHGSFTAAAGMLFVTQPAVTAQVKALEEGCSLKLFKKKGRQIHLTEEGQTSMNTPGEFFSMKKRSRMSSMT